MDDPDTLRQMLAWFQQQLADRDLQIARLTVEVQKHKGGDDDGEG